MERQLVSVLIIDDELFLRRTIQDCLLDEGRFDVQVAGDAEEGLELLARRMVDVCLVDIRLPGLNGIEFMLKAQQLDPNLRFIIHTGSPEEQLPESVIRDVPGFRGLLFKPVFDMGDIVRAIDAAVL
jgi:DNA-binding NarL/FixJ family response regulator